jgi:hypothetical protein
MIYQWLVFAHILAVFGFLLAHGSATAVAFRLRSEREVERIRALLDLSRGASAVGNASLLALLAFGVAAGFVGDWWGRYWIWTALGLLIVISIAMTLVGSGPLIRIRQLVGATGPSRAKPAVQPRAGADIDEKLAALQATVHPVLLTVIGGGGLAVILWLMLFKPF